MSRPTVDLGYPTEAHGRIPAFNSVEEEAAFWDTHDVTDYLDESRPTAITVGREVTERLILRLEQADRESLERRARAKGIGPSTLVRIWIKERRRRGGRLTRTRRGPPPWSASGSRSDCAKRRTRKGSRVRNPPG